MDNSNSDFVDLIKIEHLARELQRAHYAPTKTASDVVYKADSAKAFVAAILWAEKAVAKRLGISNHYELIAYIGAGGEVGWELQEMNSTLEFSMTQKWIKVGETISDRRLDQKEIKDLLLERGGQNILAVLIPAATPKDREQLIKASQSGGVEEYSGRHDLNKLKVGVKDGRIKGVLIDRVLSRTPFGSLLNPRESERAENWFYSTLEITGGHLKLWSQEAGTTSISLAHWGRVWNGSDRPMYTLLSNARELGLSAAAAKGAWRALEMALPREAQEGIVQRAEALTEASLLSFIVLDKRKRAESQNAPTATKHRV